MARVVALPSVNETHSHTDPERAIRLTSNLISILTSTGLAPGAHPLLALSRLHSLMLIENLPDLSQALPLSSDPLLDPPAMSTPLAVGASQQSFAQLEGQKEERGVVRNEEERSHAEDAQQKLDDAIRDALHTSTGLSARLYIEKSGHATNAGRNTLILKSNGREVLPTMANPKRIIDVANNDISFLARLVRALTNHVPTGEYRRGWHPEAATECQHDHVTHTRNHILTECQAYFHVHARTVNLRRFSYRICQISQEEPKGILL